jgi:hypothetical protein
MTDASFAIQTSSGQLDTPLSSSLINWERRCFPSRTLTQGSPIKLFDMPSTPFEVGT